MTQGRGQTQRLRLGGTRDGRITHYELSILQDAGAYPGLGAYLPTFTQKVFTGVYDIANASVSAESYLTSAPTISAYRGAGRPEGTHAIERVVDLFAAEIGMDPVEVRRRNFIPVDAFPYETPGGSTYDSGDYDGCLDKALAAAGYEELRAEQARRRAADDPVLMGIGVSVYVEVTAVGGGTEFGSATLTDDGKLVVRTGSTPYGQGHDTSWAMLASDKTGIPMEDITIIHGDTDEVQEVFITVASRSAQLAGSSVDNAAGHQVELARERRGARPGRRWRIPRRRRSRSADFVGRRGPGRG
jgi:carbon-monoxide dehydrogenase large subunit